MANWQDTQLILYRVGHDPIEGAIDIEIPVTVEYEIDGKYYPATWDEPAFGGEVLIYRVTDADGNKIEITDKENEQFCEEILAERADA